MVRGLDWLAARLLPKDPRPERHRIGQRGEEALTFTGRKLGYTIVARNFGSPRCRGEIDLIGGHEDVLCFIEVKAPTSPDVKPAGQRSTVTSDENLRNWHVTS